MSDCPKCRTIELKRPSSGTQVLRCYTCHGMWVTPDEAKNLVARFRILQPLRPLCVRVLFSRPQYLTRLKLKTSK